MQTLVINLARAPGRWASIAALGAARGLDIERLEAIDGSDPRALATGACHPSAGETLRPGEIACFESHRAAWKRIAAGRAPHVMVLEDDVFLAEDIAPWLAAAAAALPALDIVKLNAHPRGALLRGKPLARVAGRAVVEPVQCTNDASAYLISRAFAERALSLHARYSRPLDVALYDPASGVRLGHADPALAIQQQYATFRFLEESDEATSIQTSLAERRSQRPRKGPAAAAAAELRRLGRRKIWPALQPGLNLLRPAAERVEFRRIPFAESSGAMTPPGDRLTGSGSCAPRAGAVAGCARARTHSAGVGCGSSWQRPSAG